MRDLRETCLAQHGLFFCPPSQSDVPIRNRENVQSSNLRKPDYLPPAEIRQALAALVRVHLGMTSDQAATEVARLFGFRSTSAQIKQIIQDEVGFLLEQNILEQRNGKLYVGETVTVARTS